MQEEEFFRAGAVYITRTRAVFDGETFAIANISVVRLHYVRKLSPFTIVLLVIAAIALIVGFNTPPWDNTRSIFFGGGGVLLVAAGVVQYFWPKKEYTFELKANSGDSHRFTVEDQKFAEGVKSAIEEAMALRV